MQKSPFGRSTSAMSINQYESEIAYYLVPRTLNAGGTAICGWRGRTNCHWLLSGLHLLGEVHFRRVYGNRSCRRGCGYDELAFMGSGPFANTGAGLSEVYSLGSNIKVDKSGPFRSARSI
jgi:hypothetical protein